MRRRLLFFACQILFAVMLCQPADAQAGLSCGDIQNAYGPYDYTNPVHRAEFLPIVEQFHFDVGVQSLKGLSGQEYSEARIGGDIGYTLRAFPNHHKALYAMIRYYREKVPIGSPRMLYAPECWFDRAKRFAAGDATVVMLEGLYFQKTDQFEEAKRAYEAAIEMAPDSAEIHYNAGLLYIDLNEYDLAMEHAARAYELGHPLPGLRNKLKRLGEWKGGG